MMHNFSKLGQEDCLFLNVYSPRLPESKEEKGLPVMVWVHGGGFISGSGDDDIFGVDYLLDEDVVVVTFNYRLGVFGFITTEDGFATGNLGLRDQALALQWVRDNIAAFGGDPELVTIFGESAGGASVSLLVASPLTKGLFHRAISQSGSASSCWCLAGDQHEELAVLTTGLGCPESGAAALECLRQKPADDIMKVVASVGFDAGGLALQFHPRVDADAKEPFVPDQPNRLLKSGRFNRVPWMMGSTQDEGLFVAGFLHRDSEGLARALKGDLEAWSSASFLCGEGLSSKTVNGAPLEVAEKIRDFVLSKGGNPTAALIKFFSDRFFTLGMSAELSLASELVPVYQYLVDHIGPGQMRFADMIGVEAPPLPLVSHGDDMAYLFRAALQRRPEPGSPEYALVRLFVRLWTSFAQHGYPSAPELGVEDWPIYTSQSGTYLRLNAAPALAEKFAEERVRFWESLPLKEPWNAQRWSSSKDGHDEL
ncbi:juvenile hormone esterase-like [Amphibalanus amphitrite]|uniref:juvenile hormone esterase-like n=1 Tax=Amphibalanus amphitrite TaxID=1232801 RepID=UPI001C8FEE6F|nr:juvenile hormone esterase-like [Amphibalanus amphitrite]